MDDHSASEARERWLQSIRRAEEMLAAADEALAQAGFGSAREARQALESRLCAQEIADIDDEVEREIRRIAQEVAVNHIPSPATQSSSARKRHFRQVI